MNKKNTTILFLLTVLILSLALLFDFGTTSKEINKIEGELAVEFWGEKIREVGGEKAYKLFKEEVGGMDFGSSHFEAHQFGEALYEEESTAAITICDGEFGFGCFHQVFLSAISDHGVNVVGELEEECINKFGLGGLGCTHGIGHGLVEYMGGNRLDDALDICDTLQWKEPLLGCKDGVFMEYNFPTIIKPEEAVASTRDLDIENPHEPCSSVSSKYKPACYFSQPTWWLGAGLTPVEIGKLCIEASEGNYKSCFKGLGDALVHSLNYDSELIAERCDESSPGVNERIACRAGGHWGLWKMSGELRNRAENLCNFEEQEECLKEADLVSSGLQTQ